MPQDKRTIEAHTSMIRSVQSRDMVNKESGSTKKKTAKINDQKAACSKEVILRLIGWLEKE